jgi:peptidoglycan/LPS O-acetylase OafA/YrhL
MYRLYPAIAAYTIAVMAIVAIRDPERMAAAWREPLAALTYVANYLYAWYSVKQLTPQLPFQIFWSLAVEFQFYLMLPAAMLLLRGDAKRVFALAVAACIIPLIIRLVVATLHPGLVSSFYFYFRTETRIDSIATGVLVAAACEIPAGRRIVLSLARSIPIASLAGAVALACLIIFREPFFRETLRYTLLDFSAAILLISVVFADRYRWVNLLLNSVPFIWIGEVSYSLYVWHEGASNVVRGLLPSLWHPALIVLVFAACFATATLSYYAIERPFQGIRARLLARAQNA